MPHFLGMPPGLVRDVASYIYHAAPYPNETMGVVGGIGLIAAIVGRSHNINGMGLNQYLANVAPTGTGKEQVPTGIGRLIPPLEAAFPLIGEIRGPGEIVSAPGLHKALAARRNPSMFSIIGEIGLMVAQLSSPKRDANKAGIERFLLQLYTKSDFGAVLDDAAYSDRQNNPGVVQSPALTIIGDTTPETLYGALNDRMILSGLLPRFVIFETTAPRPYQNKHRVIEPCPQLVEGLKRLCAVALEVQGAKGVRHVGMTDEAFARFDEFERWTTDRVNDAANEVTRHLWTRANVKALKLAALNAVGVDPAAPRITFDECMWATNVIVDQTNALIAKFDNGEVGEVAGNEGKQQDEVLRCIWEYLHEPFERFDKYGVTFEMHRQNIFTQTYLSRRVGNLPAFREDRIGATNALKRTIQALVDADDIREMPRNQCEQLFSKRSRAFAITHMNAFMATYGKKFGGGV